MNVRNNYGLNHLSSAWPRSRCVGLVNTVQLLINAGLGLVEHHSAGDSAGGGACACKDAGREVRCRRGTSLGCLTAAAPVKLTDSSQSSLTATYCNQRREEKRAKLYVRAPLTAQHNLFVPPSSHLTLPIPTLLPAGAWEPWGQGVK